jgi:deoxycytidine triphosphate deaminase
MLKQLVWGRYRRCTAEDRAAFLAEADRMIKEYGWENMEVHPYGYPVKITKILNDFRDYDRCTTGSKEYIVHMVNNLAEIMNAWEDYEMLPKVKILLLESEKVFEVNEDMAKMLIEKNVAKRI